MTRINTNIDALRGLRNLQKATSQQNSALTRLSTGVKVNSGRDNPAGLFAGERLKLQTTTIEKSISNSNRANNVLSTADAALGEISGQLNKLRGLVQEGLNVGALSSSETTANQGEIDEILSAINRISSNTTFAGDKLIDGSKGFQTSVSVGDLNKFSDFQVNQAVFGSRTSIALNATVNSAAEKASLRYSGGALTSAATVEIGGSNGNQAISLGGSSTVTNIADAINDVADTTGVVATVVGGFELTVDAVANTATKGSGANGVVTFTDARATAELGTNASLGGTVSVTYVAGSGNNVATSVAVTGTTNRTITVTLGTNANGAVSATADDVVAIIAGDTTASSLVTGVASGDGSGVQAAEAADTLTGGTDQGILRLGDNRTVGTSGTLSVVVDATGNSQTLGVSVGAADNDGNQVITITAATDANGVVTSTLADIATLINDDEDASEVLLASTRGDSTSLGDDVASTALSLTNGDIILESSEYGSSAKVNVTALSGSFQTTGKNDTTYTTRDFGADIGVTINGQAARGDGLKASFRTASVAASLTFATDSNEANATATLNIVGGGALFQIGEQATSAGQIGLGIEAVNTSRLGGITGKLSELGSGGGKSLEDVRKSLDGSGPKISYEDLVSIIDESLERVTTLRSQIGAVQSNVIDTNISTLGVALENISAARSEIVDTDFAAETANLQKAQVLVQAGISVLSIANQGPSTIAQLLR